MSMREQKGILLFGLILVAMLSFFFLLGGRQVQSAAKTEYTGTMAVTEVDIRSELAGRVLNVHVGEGEVVKKGQVLAEIDASSIKTQKLQAEAKLTQSRAALEKAQAGARPEEIEAARVEADKAGAAYELAQNNHGRMKELYKAGAISAQKYDESQTALKAAEADFNMAEQALALYLAGTRSEDIEAARGLVKEAEAAVAEAGVYLDKARITAPVDGEITMRAVETGDLVSQGYPLFTIADTSEKWLKVYVPENQVGGIKPGAKAIINCTAYPGDEFTGQVDRISKAPSFATLRSTDEQGEKDIVSYEVKVTVNEQQDKLLPGMTGYVAFEAGEH